jgi:predicted O-methyltransferase YrrM
MKPYQTLKLQSLVVALVFVVATLVGMQFFSPLVVILITAPLGIVALSWRLFRALNKQFELQQFKVFRQSESLAGLYGTLDIRRPLPRTRHWAASPDFLHLMAGEIFRLQPELIVEAGSGASTLIAAYCLRKLGRGKIISFDHMESYAEISRQTIDAHGLGDFAEIVHAPIRQYEIEGRAYPWYDVAELESVDRIDMLIVDGPPEDIAADARYAAVPLLISKLHEKSMVLVDDGARPGETQFVLKWQQNYGLHYSSQLAEKGAYCCYFSDAG